jgi:hypothetical protein
MNIASSIIGNEATSLTLSFTPEATHSNLVTPVSSSLATNQLSFNQLVSLTNSNYTVNSESNNKTNTNKQIDIMQMLTKAQNQYNQSNNGGVVKTILEPPTSHSTPGSLSTHSLVGTQEPPATTGAEPKPIAQWPHDLFLNSNQFIKKPEPLRRATNGVLDNGQQQQSNTSLNTSSSISGGITCSPPSSTSSSVTSSSSSSSTTSSSSSATSNIHNNNNNTNQKQSNNALFNLLMSSTSSSIGAAAAPSASACLDNPKIQSSMFNTNGYVFGVENQNLFIACLYNKII